MKGNSEETQKHDSHKQQGQTSYFKATKCISSPFSNVLMFHADRILFRQTFFVQFHVRLISKILLGIARTELL